VQIMLKAVRTVEQKKALYARIVGLLAERPGVQPEDVLINLVGWHVRTGPSAMAWHSTPGRPETGVEPLSPWDSA